MRFDHPRDQQLVVMERVCIMNLLSGGGIRTARQRGAEYHYHCIPNAPHNLVNSGDELWQSDSRFASTGSALGDISTDPSNLLNGPATAAFGGDASWVANYLGNTVAVFKAAD